MDLFLFAEGPLLWIAFLTFIIGSVLRAAMFFFVSLKKDKIIYQYFSWKYVLATYCRWLLPLNKDFFTVMCKVCGASLPDEKCPTCPNCGWNRCSGT